MTTPRATTRSRLDDAPVSPRLRMSALWTAVMFVYTYVDVIAFYQPGTIDAILAGRVWEFEITQTWAFGAVALMTVPAVMIPLTLTLPARIARRATLTVAGVYALVSIGNPIGEPWAFYWLGATVQLALLVTIISTAVRWPHQGE